MSIDGEFGIKVAFHDKTNERMKVVQFSDYSQYTSGKVAVVTGTCGTSVVTVSVSPTRFRNSTGDEVSFSSISRVAFIASELSRCVTSGDATLVSRSNHIAVCDTDSDDSSFVVRKEGTSGTASYTLVLYGS